IAVSGADVAKPGIITLDFDLSQASYQVGILAARVSKSGKLGFLGGAKIPSVLGCLRGFTAGAQSVRPDVTVAAAYPGWDQPSEAKAQTEAMFRAEVDVVYQDVDAASRGVFEAVSEAAKAGKAVWAIGSCADQNANPACAERMLASAVIRLDRAFRRLADATIAGSFKPGLVTEGLANDACIAVLNPKLVGSVITPAMQSEISEAGKLLTSGKLVIPLAK
ncbi:MAG: BMP family ABC transporter substrate-binding protein, partial [Planctomycetota bacterium]